MMTIAKFCDRHNACSEGRAWALANCRDMQHAWETLKPEWLIWVATRPGVLTDRELHLFAVWSARQVQHLMTDPRSIAALDVAERYANGQATDKELAAARVAALDVARAASGASTAAWVAVHAARVSARIAVLSVTLYADTDAQYEWLRQNMKPNFV